MQNLGSALAVTVVIVVSLAILGSEWRIYRLRKELAMGARRRNAIAKLRAMSATFILGAAVLAAASLVLFK